MPTWAKGAVLPSLSIAVWEMPRDGAREVRGDVAPVRDARCGVRGLADGYILLATWQTFEAAAVRARDRGRARASRSARSSACRVSPSWRRADRRGAAADPRGGIHSADAAAVRLRPADGRPDRRLCLRLADPDRNSGRRAAHRAAADGGAAALEMSPPNESARSSCRRRSAASSSACASRSASRWWSRSPWRSSSIRAASATA